MEDRLEENSQVISCRAQQHFEPVINQRSSLTDAVKIIETPNSTAPRRHGRQEPKKP